MKLEQLTIRYNPYNFINQGIPPCSYGGVIEFSNEQGKISVELAPADIKNIVGILSGKVADDINKMSNTIADDVRNSFIDNDTLLEITQDA